jgi:hypothetical protein
MMDLLLMLLILVLVLDIGLVLVLVFWTWFKFLNFDCKFVTEFLILILDMGQVQFWIWSMDLEFWVLW